MHAAGLPLLCPCVRGEQDGVSCLALHERTPLSSATQDLSQSYKHYPQRRGHGTKTLMLATGSWDAAVKVLPGTYYILIVYNYQQPKEV